MTEEIKQLRGKVRFINDIMDRIETNTRLRDKLDEYTEICAVDYRDGAEIDIESYSDDLFNVLLDLVPAQLEKDIKLLKETIK